MFLTDRLCPKIMRVPGKDRLQLVHDRVKELQKLIAGSCTAAQTARSRAGLLLEIEGLQTYMHEAFSTFSEKLDSPFDFIKASLLMSSLSTEFSNSLLRLLRGVVDLWKDKVKVSAFELIFEICWLIASCINLDATRQGVQGGFKCLITLTRGPKQITARNTDDWVQGPPAILWFDTSHSLTRFSKGSATNCGPARNGTRGDPPAASTLA